MSESLVVRPAAGGPDVEAIQRLASKLWPAGWHPGGLGWALARDALADEVVVAVDEPGGAVAGWASRGGHDVGELHAQVDRGRHDIAAALVDWMVAASTSFTGPVRLPVWDGARELQSAVEGAGFAPGGRDEWSGLIRMAGGAAEDRRRTVSGYAIRAVGESKRGRAERVAVHRAAWRPASIPYIDGRPVDPTAESSFTAESYDAVRAVWLYEPHLDLVAIADEGEFAACCIGWLDPATGVAEIEPMGVAPDHRRRGLAVALCLEVAARVSALGGVEVFINGSPNSAYPAPSSTYLKAGFRIVERATTYIRGSGVSPQT